MPIVTVFETKAYESSAILSACRGYRYVLRRSWGVDGTENEVMFIGLNPSTADENTDDHTVRRCVGFAKSWGYSSLVLLNLFAYRATNPKELLNAEDPVGKDNDYWLRYYALRAKKCVAAWGMYGSWFNRDATARSFLSTTYCFGTTLSGAPRHPLYLSSNTRLKVYR